MLLNEIPRRALGLGIEKVARLVRKKELQHRSNGEEYSRLSI